MKKRLLVLCSMTLFLLSAYSFTSFAEQKAGESKTYTVDDINNGFANYSNNSTNLKTRGSSTNSNVVGTVFDDDTGVIIENASIEIDNQVVAKTDYNGRFQILGLADGEYTWTVSKDGYKIATYENYPVTSQLGASVFSFYISKENEISQDFLSGMDDEQQSPTDFDATPSDAEQYVSDYDTRATLSLSSFKVIYPNGKTLSPTRDFYISHVISKELYAPNSGHYPSSMTSAQYLELYKAQAVVARTYADYIVTHYNKHGQKGILCSTTDCQAFDPTYTNEVAIKATLGTTSGAQEYVVTYNGSMIEATFFAHCNGNTKSAKSVWGNDIAYLQSVSCPYDISGGSYFGHGVGFCQDGAAGYAARGTGYKNIVTHYYKNSSVSLADSTIVTGWKQEDDGSWYYYDSNGRMKTGWVQVSGQWYYMNSLGVMQTDWVQDGSDWYFLRGDGSMKAGEWQDWPRGSQNWYYLQADGRMAYSCTLLINNLYYDFNSSGLCTTPNGYTR